MTLLELISKHGFGNPATATVATSATQRLAVGSAVASVATVAVANVSNLLRKAGVANFMGLMEAIQQAPVPMTALGPLRQGPIGGRRGAVG